MMPHILERSITMSDMQRTMKNVLRGLFHRYEGLSESSHAGWIADALHHRQTIQKIQGRILDQVALFWPDGQLPDRVVVTHDHNIYQADFVEGTLKIIGEKRRYLPDEVEVMHVFEVA